MAKLTQRECLISVKLNLFRHLFNVVVVFMSESSESLLLLEQLNLNYASNCAHYIESNCYYQRSDLIICLFLKFFSNVSRILAFKLLSLSTFWELHLIHHVVVVTRFHHNDD